MLTTRFRNRQEAGQRLAGALDDLPDDVVVIALPRGGVPVAAEVARSLHCPLDVLIVRKLGAPIHPELGFGAVAEHGIRVLNHELIRQLGITAAQIDDVAEREGAEAARRVRAYRRGRPMVSVNDKTVVLIDDGIATGFTIKAAVAALRSMGPAKVIIAVPVAAPAALAELRSVADEVFALEAPEAFEAIGKWYGDFRQVSDRAVAEILEAFDGHEAATGVAPARPVREREIEIGLGRTSLPGTLMVPPGALGVVLFAHGSGSSRRSPRNVAVARALQQQGMATLLFDLLTPSEATSRSNVFDVDLLADRLHRARTWIAEDAEVAALPVGYFGASTGAAAALAAATRPDAAVTAVVSRGGRPDLAGAALPRVDAPTLLIVGGRDHTVLGLNRWAQRQLGCANQLEVIPGAGHLFEEPGTLDVVTDLATRWFTRWFALASAQADGKPNAG